MKFKFLVFIGSIMISVLSISCDTKNKPRAKIADIANKKIENQKIQEVKSENTDIEKIVKKSIDIPVLQQYYHIDTNPDRSPLIIVANEKLTKNTSIKKFGKEVLFSDKETLEKQHKAYLEFTKINISKTTASIEISYPIEGVACKIEFIKEGEEWIVKNSQLLER